MKSVVAPDQLANEDQSLDLYRVVEIADINFTIRQNPLLGVGFGQPFLRPYPLPSISSWILAVYMSHNWALWIWMKMGFFGFVTVIYLLATAMRSGARSLYDMRDDDPDLAVLTLTSTAFVLMYAIFTYVDISWDARNLTVLALAFAHLEHEVPASVHRRPGSGGHQGPGCSVSLRADVTRVLRDEVGEFDPRAASAMLAAGAVPAGSLSRFRATLLRLGGFSIGSGASSE